MNVLAIVLTHVRIRVQISVRRNVLPDVHIHVNRVVKVRAIMDVVEHAMYCVLLDVEAHVLIPLYTRIVIFSNKVIAR